MSKDNKASAVIKLLKKGYSPKEITQRVAVSYNYAWKLKRDLEAVVEDIKTTTLSASSDFLESLSQGKGKPKPEPEVSGMGDILNKRGSNYGIFIENARVAQRLKAVAHQFAGQNNKTFDADQAEALDMIFSKIARILNGDPHHIDNWIDIAGYATLVADRLQGKIR
jgi:hypothetical protein